MKTLLKYIEESSKISSLDDYIKESIEDGKYVDLPSTKLYKTFYGTVPSKSGYGSAEAYQAALDKYKAKKKAHADAWKEHQELLKKIDAENLDILVDKLTKFMQDTARHDDFIKTEVARVLESIKNNPSKNEKSQAEKELLGTVTSLRRALMLEETSIGGRADATMEESIYKGLCLVAYRYNIDLPKWSSVAKEMVAKGESALIDDYDAEHGVKWRNKENAPDKWKSFREKAKKNSEAAKKFRQLWAKTDQYKKLVKLVDMYEDDVETIMKAIDRAYTRFDVLNGKNKAWSDMSEKMAPKAQKALSDAFGKDAQVTCYGVSLIDILVTVGLAGDENPKIDVLDKGTTSWLSGMQHYCKFKVTDKDGKTYETGKYEDRGLGNGDGFGAKD